MASPFRDIPADGRRLIAMRGLRSIAQGALVVDFALYAKALGWSATFLGAVLGGGFLVTAALTAWLGPLSDRVGRRSFLLGYECLMILAALVALVTPARWPLVAAAALGGFGRGVNGAAGPFGPVEQSWLAGLVPRETLGQTMSLNAAVGNSGMGVGAILAGLPALWGGLHPAAVDYRPLFGLAMASAIICLALLLRVRDLPRAATEPDHPAEAATARAERGSLLRLAGLNALNGMGIGLVGPLISYWFARRFGVGPALIGPVMGVSLGLTALSSLGAGALGARFGTVRIVIWMRGAGLAMLLALPFAPNFAVAAVLYGLRSALNRGTAGSRQALAMGLVRGHRRGLAASVNALSIQLPRALGPALAGLFFAAGALTTPFLIAALFQGGYLVLYPRLFAGRRPDPG